MINFNQNPYVLDLLISYSEKTNDSGVGKILELGVQSSEDAYQLAKFVWSMADQLFIENQSKESEITDTDNRDLLTDVDLELRLYLSSLGYKQIWEDVCDEY